MAVSKRLRFEILRRDNHQCRYCGATAPDATLTIDHVVPAALGGGDDPTNLVTACRDCNAGKSSISADAGIVADVASDAIRWADAMAVVARARAQARQQANELYLGFESAWKNWYYTDWRGQEIYADLPGDWRRSIDQFLDAGLELDDLTELIRVAMNARTSDEWRYFCGCCWRRIRENQEMAASILKAEETPEHG